MPRKGENIYKRKDGRWEGRYIKDYPNGKAAYGYVYAKSYRDVKQKLTLATYNTINQPICIQLQVSENKIRFCDLAADWMRTTKPQIKESSYIKYRNLLHSYVFPVYEEEFLDTMTHESIENFCNMLLLSGGVQKKGLSPKTVSDVLSLLHSIFSYAEKRGHKNLCNTKGIIIRQCHEEMTVLSQLEQEQLYQYLIENPSDRNLGILICLFTGLRIGEVCALCWEDISMHEKTIHVHGTMQRIQTLDHSERKTKVIISTPKSKCSIRTIPIPDNIARIIEENYTDRHGYVLTNSDVKYVEPRTMENYFKRVMGNNSLKPVNFHTLRHTFATRCVEVGFDVKSLSEILGHASVNITMNRYVHPTMELKRSNMQKLSNLFAVK